MKILFISDVYFPRVNGVSTSIKTFAGQLALLGHQVDLIAPNYGAAGDLNVKGKSIMRVSARSIFFDPEDKLMKYTEALTLLPNLQAAEYDLIHINTPFIAHFLGLKFAKILNIPCIETYHTFFEDYLHHYCPWFPKSIARSIARIVSKRQCNAVDAIVSPSQPMLDVLRTYGVTAQAEVIPTGMLPASFANADTELFKEKYGIDKDRSTLLYVGRVAFEKNITFLLEMTKILIKKHSNVLLVIAGEGPAKAYLHQLSEKLNLGKNVRFIGYLDRNSELNACYKSADFLFLPQKVKHKDWYCLRRWPNPHQWLRLQN